MTPEILYEDSNLLVVNKPSGMVVHPYDYSDEATVLDFLREHDAHIFDIDTQKKLQDGRTINLGGMVHKLDRDTSGVLVIAKNTETFEELKLQFTTHRVQKTYNALVDGVVENDEDTIDAPLGRNKKDYKQRAYPDNPRGELRDALTEIAVISRSLVTNTTLVKLMPKTGRTHQLRAHMSYYKHPIVGDIAYGSTVSSPRIMLHALSISFTLFGKDYAFEAPLPPDFTFDTIK